MVLTNQKVLFVQSFCFCTSEMEKQQKILSELLDVKAELISIDLFKKIYGLSKSGLLDCQTFLQQFQPTNLEEENQKIHNQKIKEI